VSGVTSAPGQGTLPGLTPKGKPRKKRPKALAYPEIPELPRDRWFKGRVLAVDASSTAMGLVMIHGGEIKDTRLVKPPDSLDSIARARWMARHLSGEIRTQFPDVVLIERTTGMHHAARPVAVSVASFAQGVLYVVVTGLVGFNVVHFVAENQWTRGLGKKKQRVESTRLAYPEIANEHDPGGDIADAVGLGMWWIQRHEG
jgi:hypothetical protein